MRIYIAEIGSSHYYIDLDEVALVFLDTYEGALPRAEFLLRGSDKPFILPFTSREDRDKFVQAWRQGSGHVVYYPKSRDAALDPAQVEALRKVMEQETQS